MAWGAAGNYGIKIEDDFDPADKSPKYLPPSVLLDQRWYALGFKKKSAPLTIRVFDIVADPGCTHDLSTARHDLCARAAAVFGKVNH